MALLGFPTKPPRTRSIATAQPSQRLHLHTSDDRAPDRRIVSRVAAVGRCLQHRVEQGRALDGRYVRELVDTRSAERGDATAGALRFAYAPRLQDRRRARRRVARTADHQLNEQAMAVLTIRR